ncbi:MAG: dihydrofolate reductase [Sphingobacteriia bacterium]|nr:dihydrofolate reductase [Sphingobacteriia bacterium]
MAVACTPTERGVGKTEESKDGFKFLSEQFADLKIIRYQIPGFETLSPKQQELAYYLYQAALSGRDIIWDQNYKHNLLVRKTLEGIVSTYSGDKKTPEFEKFMEYTKRVWFSNGIHHHYSSQKILPEFTPEFFQILLSHSSKEALPISAGQSVEDLGKFLSPILFDPNVDGKRVNKDPNADLVLTSAGNNYEGVTQKEAEEFYAKMENPAVATPVWFGLNSKLVKENGKLTEKTWKIGGMYGSAIEKIVFWLKKAVLVAESPLQAKTFQKLIEFYETGDLKKFDEYNILWVQDTTSRVDAVNGFIEVYGDPLGHKASYESVVSFKDMEATQRIAAISNQAQWFEDHSPLLPEHKKPNVTGISAKVITVVVEAGDASPSTPIGINLPNADWIRKIHGSKSVNLGNIVNAYAESGKGSGMLQEFAASPEEIKLDEEYGTLAGNLHTDMHEVIGHASGQINPGIGSPKQTLINYASTLEEARADLVALYYILDQKLVEIGVMKSLDVGKCEYNSYIRNGLMTQLVRLKPGEEIEEDHMRNRQLVAAWAYEKGKADKVIEFIKRDNKTYVVINNYEKLRTLFGELLREIQRIKSEGDFEAGKKLVETYGVKVDPILHTEVLERYAKLKISPYGGFINPRLVAVTEGDQIKEIKIEYPENFTDQMMEYGKNYSFLPVRN